MEMIQCINRETCKCEVSKVLIDFDKNEAIVNVRTKEGDWTESRVDLKYLLMSMNDTHQSIIRVFFKKILISVLNVRFMDIPNILNIN